MSTSGQPVLKTAQEWQNAPADPSAISGAVIANPDGWRQNDGVTWETPITWESFLERFYESTLRFVGNP